MEEAKITLKDPRSGKTITISSTGDTNANIVIPINKDLSLTDEVMFNFIDMEEVGNIIANKFSPGCILTAPSITHPLNTTTGYTGGVTLAPYTLPELDGDRLVSAYYEISKSRDFREIIFSKIKSGIDRVMDLDPEDMVNVGLGSSNEVNIDNEELYYVRCKLFINSYSTEWSNIGSFKYDNSSYVKPANIELTNIIQVDAQELFPHLKSLPLSSERPSVRTGEVKVKVSPPQGRYGSPGEPDLIIFKFGIDDSETSVPDNISRESNDIEIKCTNSEYYTLDLIPNVIPYGKKIKAKYKYKNSTNNIESPWSDYVTLIDTPLELNIDVIDFGLVTELSKVSKHKTINVDDVLISDRYILKHIHPEFWVNSMYTPEKTTLDNFNITFAFSGKKEGSQDFSTLRDNVIKTISQGQSEYLGVMVPITHAVDEGFSYDFKLLLTCNILPIKTNITKEVIVRQNVPASDGITGEEIENTPRKETPDGQYGYFGEISDNPKELKFLGHQSKIKESLFDTLNFEYINTDGKLFINYIQGQTRINKEVDKLSESEYGMIYGSSLTTSTNLLASKLQLSNSTRPGEKYNVFNDQGDLVKIKEYSLHPTPNYPVIKCFNRGNQIVFIGKYPLSNNIPYSTLRSKFLSGSGSHTFRYGSNIFKARLLEYAPAPCINPHYPDRETDRKNITDDIQLYKNLFGNRLANYFQGDLGIATNNDITYTNSGWIRTFKYGNVIKHTTGKLNFHNWDDIDKLEEHNDDGTTSSNTVKNRIGLYRPVFEYVRNSHIPFRLMKKSLPGPTHLQYDKATDTGYFGKVSSSEFFQPKEVMTMLNLTLDNLVDEDYNYFKFYYHGKILYIPTQPMVVINNSSDFKKLLASGCFHGNKKLESYNIFKNNKFSISSISFGHGVYTTQANSYNEHLLVNGKSTSIGEGIYHSLISRCLQDPFLNDSNTWPTNYPWVVWEDNGLLSNTYPIITTDIVDGENAFISRSGLQLIKRSEVGDRFLFWPVFTIEALDLSETVTYGKWNVRPGEITYKTIKVTKNQLTPKTVTRKRPVIKHKITYEDKVIVQTVKVPNGKITFQKVPKDSSDQYGILLFHTSKQDPSCNSEPLYRRDRLNVKKYQNEYRINYSDNLKSIDDYIVKNIVSSNQEGLAPQPLHVAITFRESISCRNFIRDMLQDNIELCVLKNYTPDIPYTDGNWKYPLGVLYGMISSMISYYPINKGYNLYNKLENIIGEMNLNPLIINKNNRYLNTWTTMSDNSGLVTVPCLSGFLDYMDYSLRGKEIIDHYAKYLAVQYRLPTSPDQIDNSLGIIKNTYNFGIVGVELSSLHIMKERNGVLTGSFSDPILRDLPKDYKLMNYFTNSFKSGYSNGNDFIDIMNPEQGYDEVEKETTIQVPVSTPYIEMEDYQEVIYETVVVEEEIQIPVYTYE